jgi:ADP-ribose pyrophosphatase YjhB (NUDIX family)
MRVKFCARCGAELTTRFESGRDRPACPECDTIVYSNPAPVGIVVAMRGDRLLLVQRRNPPLAGYWAPPAGHIEFDESVQEGTARETKEETGFEVSIGRLLNVYSQASAGVVLVVYAGQITGGNMAADEDEVMEVRFFGRDELPRQPAPTNGTIVEGMFFQSIEEMFEDFRKQ